MTAYLTISSSNDCIFLACFHANCLINEFHHIGAFPSYLDPHQTATMRPTATNPPRIGLHHQPLHQLSHQPRRHGGADRAPRGLLHQDVRPGSDSRRAESTAQSGGLVLLRKPCTAAGGDLVEAAARVTASSERRALLCHQLL